MKRSLVSAGLLVAHETLAAAPATTPAPALLDPTTTAPAIGVPVRAPARHFVNPICEGADPWVTRDGVHYYFCQTEGHDGIAVLKSTRLTDKGAKRIVWRPQRGRWNSRDIWAPELHKIQGRWYIYYTASDGKNENHRSGVLRARTDDPQGPYEDMGVLYTGDDIRRGRNNRWAIDATPLELGNKLYLVWSGWPDERDVQYLYIARMENPWTVATNRVKLCENDTYVWERVSEKQAERGLNEGPQILRHNGRIFIVYSCSSSWEPTYKLNMLYMNESSDPMMCSSWRKAERPVFQSTRDVYGIGHASFTTSPDGTEDWILFHAKRSRKPGWERAIWAQPFTWTADGMPDFGTPLAAGRELPVPSGEGGNREGNSFSDAFSDQSWDRWVYYGHTRYIDVVRGRLQLGAEPGAAATNRFRSGEKALVRGLDFSDASIRVRMRIRSERREAGVLVRVNEPALGYDAQKGYFAGLNSGTNQLVLAASDGSETRPIIAADFPVSPNQWYTLRVDTVGDSIRVYVDDELMITARDGRFSRGMAGVRVVDTHAEFDDFEIAPAK